MGGLHIDCNVTDETRKAILEKNQLKKLEFRMNSHGEAFASRGVEG